LVSAGCNTINLILAWIAFLVPVLVTNSGNGYDIRGILSVPFSVDGHEFQYAFTPETYKVAFGVWSACRQDSHHDDWSCYAYHDNNEYNPALWYFDSVEHHNTPHHMKITQGLYTTAIILVSFAAYSACAAISVKKLGMVSAGCNFLAGVFFLAVSIFMFGTNRFLVRDGCLGLGDPAVKSWDVLNCTNTYAPDSGLYESLSNGTSFCENWYQYVIDEVQSKSCYGWNYSAIYCWIAWLLCWMCAGLSGATASGGEEKSSEENAPINTDSGSYEATATGSI
jgi:hypothetical protein